ncbi:MAG: hypothetical protein QNJ73_06495 [Gammaproteobacteria bacterium]|nr:hypothetical protein [Gammaproteobacteria bacterium]
MSAVTWITNAIGHFLPSGNGRRGPSRKSRPAPSDRDFGDTLLRDYGDTIVRDYGDTAVQTQTDIKKDFRGVQIHPGPRACKLARAQKGERYLMNDAPSLPLPECDAASCNCRYVKLRDRRSWEPRRLELGQFGSIRPQGSEDRRAGRRDRRKSVSDD